MHRLQEALADRYTIEREVGRGGFSLEFLARDQRLGRNVALKVLRPELCASIAVDRFTREVKIAACLQHRNIIPLYDASDANGLPYYVMRYVEGETNSSSAVQRNCKLNIYDSSTSTGLLMGLSQFLPLLHSQLSDVVVRRQSLRRQLLV